ncbi:MAG: DUF3810 domain-containing protein [Clostridia bacterium]|nr:DUF3810 domain-containing protein [Clostridia bacterium]
MTDKAPKNKKERLLNLPSVILLSLAALSAVILLISALSPEFAAFFHQYVGGFVRIVLAYLTNLIPFSLAELLIILLPVAITVFVIYTIKNKNRKVISHVITLLSVLSVIFSSFVFSFGTGYHTPSLYERFDISKEKPSVLSLKSTANTLIAEINFRVPDINYGADGSSVIPYSMDKMNGLLVDAYKPISEKYKFVQHFDSNIKPVFLSRPMAYTHTTGIYTFFTGEANLNMDFPDYTLAFTAAHELAHQRGISREDEANFFAFLACINSGDTYLEYCAYMNVFEFVVGALKKADADAYSEVMKYLSSPAKDEMRAYAKYYSKYEKALAGKVSSSVNNAYLIANGAPEGTNSYGLVVDLTVAYLNGAFD